MDVISVLTGQKTTRGASNYWAKLKQRLKDEGANELLTNCQQLKMTAADGKKRLTDVADTEQLLRIIQSVPSPKAEPFKAWLAMIKGTSDENIGFNEILYFSSEHIRVGGILQRRIPADNTLFTQVQKASVHGNHIFLCGGIDESLNLRDFVVPDHIPDCRSDGHNFQCGYDPAIDSRDKLL